MNKITNIEIMSPVGSYESLAAAIKARADSVYFGISKLNMRARSAANFNLKDLKKIADICKKTNVKSYLTVNTIIYDEDIKEMKKIIDSAKKSGISAIIAMDMAVLKYSKKINMEVHMSTQTNISNIEAVKFYSKYADVVVLARELTLEQIEKIIKEIKKQKIKGPKNELIKVEIFVHGALCVSISGKCYMSLGLYNHSANRGDCLQVCRRKYRVIDEETGDELSIENNYVMSLKDLCTIRFIDKLIKAGVNVFKIEGRGRSPDYVYAVTKCYKEAVEAVENKTYNESKIKKWEEELSSVFNRGFWHGGYYLGKKLGEWAGSYGSKATKEKYFIGIGKHYFPKSKIGEFIVQKDEIKINDEILITGETTGVIKGRVESLYINEKPVKSAKKGDEITLPVSEKIRKGDKLYVIRIRKKLQGN